MNERNTLALRLRLNKAEAETKYKTETKTKAETETFCHATKVNGDHNTQLMLSDKA